ncbi:gamma-glutamyl-gamma-aminobutyrate hydrolase family protein [Thermococcus waiotapuensis]|uniref:Gamma-glutamyl-gamma-aminobutyrate hydrolase family protein n=1 Tax=Thermococcus waiotapuensis TaxID=90909 RepID=A0AAE4NXJ2_9EURY|nr:gamma-glutamyl-gamma-aminobutyrate hydrolase family protein [Thermococcus waiotapuensis]MDV3104535.1 gamma-glutamyl-gamma-aminobutyrate hydrolase family protein [Thermococcus waiotapuensis]
MKPLIAIIVGTEESDWASIKQQFRVIKNAGGIPGVFLPEGDPGDIVNIADGIVLTDGPDVHPYFYGDDPLPYIRSVDYDRDKFEIELFRLALKMEIPVLGISRGMQIMNVAMDGTLYQDIASEIPKAIKHDWDIRQTNPHQRLHGMRLKTASKVYEAIKDYLEVSSTNEVFIHVNSFHHQAIKKVGEGFKPIAFSIDGITEAIEREEGFYVGVQWRPEYLPEMIGLYKALINAARENHHRRIERENIEMQEKPSSGNEV